MTGQALTKPDKRSGLVSPSIPQHTWEESGPPAIAVFVFAALRINPGTHAKQVLCHCTTWGHGKEMLNTGIPGGTYPAHSLVIMSRTNLIPTDT